MLLKDARDEFLFDCECKHLAKGTIRNYKAETRFLVEFLELKQVTEGEEVKAHHIRDFMKQKQDAGSSACYVNDILKVCKTWFQYLVDEDYIEERRNPAAKVKNVRQPKTIIETFSVQEMKSLIHFYSGSDYLDVRNKTIIMLLFDTGMRCNEMIQMVEEDIKRDYIVVKHLFKHFNAARVAAITLPSDDRSFVDTQTLCQFVLC
jgi:integrase/recombinase XerD